MHSTNHDPRLKYGFIRGFTPIQLDRLPLSSDIPPEEIPRIQTKTSQYKGYSDIQAGSTLYFINEDTAPAHYPPVYAYHTPVTAKLFTDPMDTIRPEYHRELPYTRENISGNMFMQDTMYHREDIISRQQRKNNQSKYEALPSEFRPY